MELQELEFELKKFIDWLDNNGYNVVEIEDEDIIEYIKEVQDAKQK